MPRCDAGASSSSRKKTIGVGELRHRVIILHKSVEPDGYGGETTTWTELLSAWAKIETASSRVVYEWMREHPKTSHRITLRWRPGIREDMRVRFKGRDYAITGLENPGEEERWLRLMLREVDE